MYPVNINILLYLLIILTIINKINTQIENCVLNKVQYQTTPIPRVVFSYHCYPLTSYNPSFPTGGSLPTEYNEVDLSPNMYTIVPITNICQFKNIYLLDMSFNKITSITNLFKDLKCLVSLKTLIISNNFISSKIISSDFDDTFSAQLEYIDLSSNQIPSIDSDVFIKTDGTSRFKNLKYLSLSNNRLMEFDMLPPLTIPSGTLNFNFSLNPINKLVNQLNRRYSDSIFSYPIVGNRKVDVTNNILEKFDDSNLLQYGLSSSYDLLAFLNKIANYDLRQLNTQIVNCSCTTSQSTWSWYQSLLSSSSINQNSIIYQFTCYNSTLFVLAMTPNCQIVTTTTIISTTTPITFTTTNTLTASAALLLSTTTDTTLYYYLFFLLIPLIVIIILIICCCFRPINKCCYSWCNATCCTRCRPGENLKARKVTKKYDAVICYSEYDENWVHTKLVPLMAKQGKAYKIHLLTSYHKGFSKIEDSELEKLKSSKRVILLFSKNFLKEEWKSMNFQNEIKKLSAYDSDCVIIPINLGDINKEVMDENLNNLQEYHDYDASCFMCSNRLKNSTTLKTIEPLHSGNANFAEDLQFLMPIKRNTYSAATITDCSHAKRHTESPSSASLIIFESEVGGSELSFNNSSLLDDKPLVSTKRNKRSRIAPVNLVYQTNGRASKKPEKIKTNPTKKENTNNINENNKNVYSIDDISFNPVFKDKKKNTKHSVNVENELKPNLLNSSSPSDPFNLKHTKSQNENFNDLSAIFEESRTDFLNKTNLDPTNGIIPREIILNLYKTDSSERKNPRNHAEQPIHFTIRTKDNNNHLNSKFRGRSHDHDKHKEAPVCTRTSKSEHSRPRENVPRELYSNYILDESDEDEQKRIRHAKRRKNKKREEDIIDKKFNIPDKINIIRLKEDSINHFVQTTTPTMIQKKTFRHD